MSHRLPFAQAPVAYKLLDTAPDQVLSVVLSYEGQPD